MDGALTRPRVVAPARTAALDWVRGIAMALVLLSHGWALWSTAGLERIPPLLHLLQSGNLAVTVFLVVGGFLLVRSLIGPAGLAEDDAGRVGTIAADRPGRAVLSRYVRVSAQVYVLLAAVLVLAMVDDKEVLTLQQTWASVVAVATYTWNIYLQTNSPVARPDLGHLWYTAVYLQVTVLLVVLVRSLRHRRVVLLAVIGGLLLACTLWRAHVIDTEGAYRALLRTTTRMDGMLWGAVVALAWPWLRSTRAHASTLAGWSLAGFGALLLAMGNSTSYLGWGGVGANLAIAGFLVATPWLAGHPGWSRATSWRPMVVLGRYSLAVYVWHYPIFFAVARHGGGWPAPVKVVVAAVLLTAAVVLTTRYVERPLVAALARRWRDDPPASVSDRRRADASAG
jgi:peptidoglycan/LPS O-acetylase OafA/YrhL